LEAKNLAASFASVARANANASTPTRKGSNDGKRLVPKKPTAPYPPLNLAPVFSEQATRARRKNMSYMDGRFHMPKDKQGTAQLHKGLTEFMKGFESTDDTAVFYPADLNKHSLSESCTSQTLPKTLSGMRMFFDGIRPNGDGGLVWINFYLGCDAPLEEVLQDAQDNISHIKGKAAVAVLQVPKTNEKYWLMNSQASMDTETWTEYLTEQMKSQLIEEGRPILSALEAATATKALTSPSTAVCHSIS